MLIIIDNEVPLPPSFMYMGDQKFILLTIYSAPNISQQYPVPPPHVCVCVGKYQPEQDTIERYHYL